MTHHPIKVLEDGTRVYSNGTRYKPKAPEERIYKVRKPTDEGAVLWQGNWLLPLELTDITARVMPETIPDTEAYDHAFKPRRCKCEVCKRPEARKWRRRGLRAKRQILTAEA